MQFSEVSIVTPTALYVQMLEAENAPVKKQVRIKRRRWSGVAWW